MAKFANDKQKSIFKPNEWTILGDCVRISIGGAHGLGFGGSYSWLFDQISVKYKNHCKNEQS